MTDGLALSMVVKARYRPTAAAEDVLDRAHDYFLGGERYRAMRLALALSLAEPTEPAAIEKGVERGSSPIEGTHLFGDEEALWASLFVASSSKLISSREQFQALVEAHLARGAALLATIMSETNDNKVEFVQRIVDLSGLNVWSERGPIGEVTPVRLSTLLGEVGIEQKTNKPLSVTINAEGVSPHIAVMGKSRSGKTRTGIQMLENLVQGRSVPVLFIDLKGEFVSEGALVAKSEWGGKTLGDRIPGLRAVHVLSQPIPLDVLARPSGNDDSRLALTALAFASSFSKCLRAKGDTQIDQLRETVLDLLRSDDQPVSLDRVRKELADRIARGSRKTNTVDAKLSTMTAVNLFAPEQRPEQFFAGRWVLGLGGLDDETRRFIVFLVLDALARYQLSQPDAPTDALKHRGVRVLLAVDEAREILGYKHDSLSKLIRQGASKGVAVMLLSQSPEDFDSEEDDFLSQVGTVMVFQSAATSVRALAAAMGRKMRPEDVSDTRLTKGVALAKLPNREPTEVLAWK